MSLLKHSQPTLELTITAETGASFAPFLHREMRRAYAALRARRARGSALVELSVVLVGDRRMGALHEAFLGIAGPTDVLTFPMEQDRRGRVTSGEVIVCVAEARRQAKVRRIPQRLEILLYAIHGLLHLLGYDDRTERAFHTMHRTEDAILTELGFGPVFAARRAPQPRPAKPATRASRDSRANRANRATRSTSVARATRAAADRSRGGSR